VKEFSSPIPSTYFIRATVVENKNIRVEWVASEEDDFAYYEVIRWVNGDNPPELIQTIYEKDTTFFIDKGVNVATTSYCYAVIVYDNCGHVSLPSNEACTVVLSGEEPPFAFDLDWTPYSGWPNGVSEYELFRRNDVDPLRPIVRVSSETLNYYDEDLDYLWGGYWYVIKAHEERNLNAESLSNAIYLIQPPLLHIPNAFTMNADELNDDWGLVPVFVKDYELNIYNRWGEKVFSTEDKTVDWSGHYLNPNKRSEVFIYTVRFTGWDRSVHQRKGTVTIVR
jgi:gliding motility-associated-like protein